MAAGAMVGGAGRSAKRLLAALWSALWPALWLALCAGALSACASVTPDRLQSRSSCNDQAGGWCDFTVRMALDSYQYAPLAQNAYEPDHETYASLPDGITMRALVPNDSIGLAYALFDRIDNGQLTEVIIAFRGTEFGHYKDWRFGNIGTEQRMRGVAVYDVIRQQLDDAGWAQTPIAVTGHSLGGAIAAQVSLMRPGVKLRVFNASPHFADAENPPPADRIAVSERGELLQIIRRKKNFPGHDTFILDCNPGESLLIDHKMRPLGDCLIWIAAYEDAAAHALIAKNRVNPPQANRYCDGDGNPLPHPGPTGYGDVQPRLCETD